MEKAIWFGTPRIDEIHGRFANTMACHLGIRLIEIGDNFLKGTMPVNEFTIQPLGYVHGGANAALAESLGSIAANLVIDRDKFFCVGSEMSISHLIPVSAGSVTGTASPKFLGRSSQVWGIEMFNGSGQLSCIARLTVVVIDRRAPERSVADGDSRSLGK